MCKAAKGTVITLTSRGAEMVEEAVVALAAAAVGILL